MITHIKGTIHAITDRSIILDTGDIGREIFLPSLLLEKQKIGTALELYTHLYIRENIMELYGFSTLEELTFFKQLIDVSGVGPKSALLVLSLASVADLKKAIAQGDSSLLMKVSGIGKKTAERLVVELKSKIESEGVIDSAGGGTVTGDGDAIDALIGLGYSAREAREALRQVDGDITDTSERLKAALKSLGKER